MAHIPQDYCCSICLSILLNPVSLLKCNHYFCHNCIDDSFEHSGSKRCPLCRKPSNQNELIPLREMMNNLMGLYPQEIAQKKKDIVIERKIYLLLGNITQEIQNNSNTFKWMFYLHSIHGHKPLSYYSNQVQVKLPSKTNPEVLTFNPETQKIQVVRQGSQTFRIYIKIYWKNQFGADTTQLYHDISFDALKQKTAIIRYRMIPK